MYYNEYRCEERLYFLILLNMILLGDHFEKIWKIHPF